MYVWMNQTERGHLWNICLLNLIVVCVFSSESQVKTGPFSCQRSVSVSIGGNITFRCTFYEVELNPFWLIKGKTHVCYQRSTKYSCNPADFSLTLYNATEEDNASTFKCHLTQGDLSEEYHLIVNNGQLIGCDTTSLDTLLADNSPYCSSLNDTLCTIERLNISYNYCYINSYDEIMALAYCEHGYRPEMFACGSSGTWIAQPITCKKIIDDTTRDETLTVTEPESRSTQDEGTGSRDWWQLIVGIVVGVPLLVVVVLLAVVLLILCVKRCAGRRA